MQPDAAPITLTHDRQHTRLYGAVLFVGYLGAIVYNLRQCSRDGRINLLWLLAIGVLVQFGWEAGLRWAESAAQLF